jgi:hypothetical protein
VSTLFRGSGLSCRQKANVPVITVSHMTGLPKSSHMELRCHTVVYSLRYSTRRNAKGAVWDLYRQQRAYNVPFNCNTKCLYRM